MLRYLGNADGTLLNDTPGQRRDINNWILTVSAEIAKFINYELDMKERSEYFQVKYAQHEFFVGARPILGLFDVYEEIQGLWAGNQAYIPLTYTGSENASACLPLPLMYTATKALRVHYFGGMALSGAISNYVIQNIVGTPTANQFVLGQQSGALGIINSFSASLSTINIEVLYGSFTVGEVLTCFTDEACATPPSDNANVIIQTDTVNATYTTTVPGLPNVSYSYSTRALCELYPEIVRACEIQIRHYWRHKDDFELTHASKDGTNIRRDAGGNIFVLQPEARTLLEPYIAYMRS